MLYDRLPVMGGLSGGSYVNCSDVYKRLLDQWRQYPTSVQEMILQVTRSEIVKKGQQSGKKVRRQQDRAYEVDPEEVAAFSRQLTADLRIVGVDSFQGGRKRRTMEVRWRRRFGRATGQQILRKKEMIILAGKLIPTMISGQRRRRNIREEEHLFASAFHSVRRKSLHFMRLEANPFYSAS
ncbi:hypothetical protein BGX38DRAFT_1160271 [Terfezia claveryi]|nr:hypothetical protein BGX38DRAFT_1160271 [Terfezia claveryi]